MRGATHDIILLFYFPHIGRTVSDDGIAGISESVYTFERFVEYIEFKEEDPEVPSNSRLLTRTRDISITAYRDKRTLKRDLTRALATPAAVVVYIGHANLDSRRTYGIVTVPNKKTPDVTNDELARMAANARAKAFFVAGCSSDGCLSATKGDTFTVVTHSGSDRVSDTVQWGAALHELFDRLLDDPPKTFGQALKYANGKFGSMDDYFIQVGGDGSMTLNASSAKTSTP